MNASTFHMKAEHIPEQFQSIIDLASQLAGVVIADALLILLEGPTDWQELREVTTGQRVLASSRLRHGTAWRRRSRFPGRRVEYARKPRYMKN